MISPNLLLPGNLTEAVPTSLVLPRSKYEETVIVGRFDGKPTAMFLTGDYTFQWFACAEGDNWQGVIVPDVRIEVDQKKIVDPSDARVPGMMIRTSTTLCLLACNKTGNSRTRIVVTEDLIDVGEAAAGFTDWQVVVGEGACKQVLWTNFTSD